MSEESPVRLVQPGTFDVAAHTYPRVPNARLHPTVRSFLKLSNERIAVRYAHLHPEVQPDAIREVLTAQPRYLRWAGADLLHVADERGVRRNVVLETNTCPSGQKSMPLRDDHEEHGGYRLLLEHSFLPTLRSKRRLPAGGLAVLCDKNRMETTGYAATLADLTGEPVYWVDMPRHGSEAWARFDDEGVLSIKHEGAWHPIRGALRYVTQQPWTRIPPFTRTFLYNPVIACLAGGRNKMMAAKAYDLFGAEMGDTGLAVRTPETIWDVGRDEVAIWVRRMGGVAVVKNPYANAGQGVWTITGPAELEEFLAADHPYDRFIVQGLVGNRRWTSRTRSGKLFHVGTVPDRHGAIYVADLRCMVAVGTEGFFPIGLYARRAPEPLSDEPPTGTSSWAMLGTNLSRRSETSDTGFTTEPDRLLLADERDFTRLGLGLDDLVEAYLQTCLAVLAIDQMAQRLRSNKGTFKRRLFASLNPDDALMAEIPV